MLDRKIIYSIGETHEAKNSDLESLLQNLKKYPRDFSDEDFKQTVSFLEENGETKEAQKINAAFRASRYDGDFINIASIQTEILDGYFKGDSFSSDDYYDFEWFFEPRDDAFIISYTDRDTGNTGANKLSKDELLKMSQKDFEHFVNESIFYDPNLNMEPERED